MKKVYISSIAVLFVAVIALYVMHFTCNNQCASEGTASVTLPDSGKSMKFAYVNIDSLLLNYNLSKDLNEDLLKQQESARTEVNEEARIFQNQMREFQRKIENNGFLTRDRAENEQQRLLKKEQELQAMNGRLSRELAIHQSEISKQLLDSITNFLEIYNQRIDCDMILSTTVGGNILYAKDGYDITSALLKELNERYSK